MFSSIFLALEMNGMRGLTSACPLLSTSLTYAENLREVTRRTSEVSVVDSWGVRVLPDFVEQLLKLQHVEHR